jgi:hypothetical protein
VTFTRNAAPRHGATQPPQHAQWMKDGSTMSPIHHEYLVFHRRHEESRLRRGGHWLAVFERLERRKG